jgi:hypothetical protein
MLGACGSTRLGSHTLDISTFQKKNLKEVDDVSFTIKNDVSSTSKTPANDWKVNTHLDFKNLFSSIFLLENTSKKLSYKPQ